MIVTFENLTLRYGRTIALNDLTATISPGIHLLLGENGAGKTSLLHVIAGLRFPTQGRCLVDGAQSRFRLPSIESKIFYLGAGMALPTRTVEELVKVHAQFYPTFSAEMLNENLAAFNIDATTKFSAMSTGTRQKAMIAYALALRTPILLLDEPATGLDISSVRTLQRLMAHCIEPEQTVIVATHHIHDLENLYDSVLMLRLGKLVLNLSTETLTERFAFITSPTPPDGALFSLPALGQFRSIVANDGALETNIDYELLYLALQNGLTL
ncbi:MAG: ABC transporter ATP-binding protein [Bacteroides sp.]|nr:ABC transporter ATP-binding protein [Bacteroides sp.]MCM1378857.1 ABC transporter ATP-binding protein [Bacteroides sp.]MCM1445474.1 ABC transporter ATP-binding protein [Prevotella sp.]